MTVAEILEQREKTYGSFEARSLITQNLKEVMCETHKWKSLDWDKKEALDTIAVKIGRILNGDSDYMDSWVDIAGYAQLVVDRLSRDQLKLGL